MSRPKPPPLQSTDTLCNMSPAPQQTLMQPSSMSQQTPHSVSYLHHVMSNSTSYCSRGSQDVHQMLMSSSCYPFLFLFFFFSLFFLNRIWLYSPDWTRTCDLSVSFSPLLGLQVYATMLIFNVPTLLVRMSTINNQ